MKGGKFPADWDECDIGSVWAIMREYYPDIQSNLCGVVLCYTVGTL